jgi:DNA methylase
MFPESFAEEWIEKLSRPGDIIMDPFSGRGTTPFQALLMDRIGVGWDINPVAACLNLAKLRAPTLATALNRIHELRRGYCPSEWIDQASAMDEFFQLAFDRDVLATLLYLRNTLRWQNRRSDAFVAALVLGALHGDTKSQKYLSNQMPRTISTKPRYSVSFWSAKGLFPPKRDVFKLLEDSARFRFDSPRPERPGYAFLGDMREIPLRWTGPEVSVIVTSPPYGAVTSYEEDQWLRLWFLGGPTRPRKSHITRDDQRQRADDYWRFIGDFWRAISFVLKPSGSIVVRLGTPSARVSELARRLEASFALSPRELRVMEMRTSEIRKRQTGSFTPGTRGCLVELDMHAVID